MNAADDRFQTIAGQTVVDREIGAAMHSRVGAWEEADQIYIARAQLDQRMRRNAHLPLRVLDVGLGIAANALALIETWAAMNSTAWLELVSVESASEGLRSVLNSRGSFPFLDRNRTLLETLLEKNLVQDPQLRLHWTLHPSSLEQVLPTLSPASFDLIFYDLYGPTEQPSAWELSRLQPTAKLLRPKTGVWLSYASATRVRSALLLSDLAVASAPATRLKREMTLAFVPDLARDLLPEDAAPLETTFLDHLRRSSNPLPSDLLPENTAQSWLHLENALKSMNR